MKSLLLLSHRGDELLRFFIRRALWDLINFSHRLDLGADLYWGHSNHTPQGIELYQGKAILYSTGDFIDDYAVDPTERNDLSFLFHLDIQNGHLERLHLHPVRIDNCRVGTATGRDAAHLERHMQTKCAAFGSQLNFQDHVGVITVR